MSVLELTEGLTQTIKGIIELAETFMSLIKGFNKWGTWKPLEATVNANIEFIEA